MGPRARLCGVFVALLVAGAVCVGCGGDDNAASDKTVTTTTTEADALPELVKQPPASESAAKPRYTPVRGVRTMDDFMTRVIRRVDVYWSRVFANSGLAEPQVTYNWLAPGERVQTACGGVAEDDSALYCPADDTIFVSQQFAYDLWRGFLRREYTGTYPGAFGVAYILAHEYAHNIQRELGVRVPAQVTRFELQADCLAGVWANSEYYAGALEGGDYDQAIKTADIAGDYDFSDPDHHGTPAQRVAAWTKGYNTGDPNGCFRTYAT